jgi:cathepsin B
MKKILLLFLISFIFCSNFKEIAKKVNSRKTTWKADENISRDFTPLLGVLPDWRNHLPPPLKIKYPLKAPETFDLRDAYPNCESLKEIRDQANCGSCWAFGAVEAMSDRICIQSGQKLQTRVSAEYLLTCCYSCGFGCSGGWPSQAFDFWMTTGIPTGGMYNDTSTCQPYFLPNCDHHCEGKYGPCPETTTEPECSEECIKEYGKELEGDKSYGKNSYSLYGEQDIMDDIYNKGSVEGAFDVYEDFMTYKSGIYKHVEGSFLGGHAIKIIGWGVEDGVKFWICVNSWNEDWGENGLFRILKGEDECGIESGVVAGDPKLD